MNQNISLVYLLNPRQYLDYPPFAFHVTPRFWSRGPTVSDSGTAFSKPMVLEHEMPFLFIFEMLPRLSYSVLD